MNRTAIFPGSFDPITLGHLDIIERAAPLFDKVIVAIGNNSNKNYMFSLEKRMEWIKETVKKFPNIEVDFFDCLTVDFCMQKEVPYIIRGLRNPADFEFEKSITHTNRTLAKKSIETVFFLTSSEKSFISSSIVREIMMYNGDYSSLVPKTVRI